MEVRDEQGFLIRLEHCDACPLDVLDRQVAQHSALSRAFDLDFALSSGIRLTLDEINVEEFRCLKVLKNERSKFEAEEMKKARRNGG